MQRFHATVARNGFMQRLHTTVARNGFMQRFHATISMFSHCTYSVCLHFLQLDLLVFCWLAFRFGLGKQRTQLHLIMHQT